MSEQPEIMEIILKSSPEDFLDWLGEEIKKDRGEEFTGEINQLTCPYNMETITSRPDIFEPWLKRELRKGRETGFEGRALQIILRGDVRQGWKSESRSEADIMAALIMDENDELTTDLKIATGLPFPACRFVINRLGDNRILIRVFYPENMSEYIGSLPERIYKYWPGSRRGGKKREGGSNTNTWALFQKFNRIKTEDPTLTKKRVAQLASDELQDNSINESTVDNAYRSMGKKWPQRGERTR